MDKERAKMILESYRPGVDGIGDEVFAEALSLAAEDYELGEWLATERERDGEFSAVLAEVEIPERLREEIFELLEGMEERAEEFDGDFVAGLASVKAPKGLREEILAAMEVENDWAERERKRGWGGWRVMAWGGSAVALLAVMVGVMIFFAGAGRGVLAGTTPKEWGDSAIQLLNEPWFSLDLENGRQAALYEWLEGRGLPSPDELPPGLQGASGVGCKILKVGADGAPASMVCYQRDGQMVHLVVMERSEVGLDEWKTMTAAVEECWDCPKNQGWALTHWVDADLFYLLFGKMPKEELAELLVGPGSR